MRELTTIGNLRAMRTLDRSARLMPLRGMGWMGATNPNFFPPSAAQVDASPPGSALTAATVAMLQHFAQSGVPSEHATTADPFVLAFQQMYNEDSLTASLPKLSEDGAFGPNVHDAAAALVDVTGGGSVPAVNTGAAPVVVVPPSTPATPATPLATTTKASHVVLWLLAIAAAVGVAYGAHRMMKKRRTRRRAAALPSRAIVLT
jgi:hypothetical protein